MSTLSRSATAVFGLTPAPRPPSFPPAIALSRPSPSLQNASSPNVAKRKVARPLSIINDMLVERAATIAPAITTTVDTIATMRVFIGPPSHL
jgi:hypothetical protein